MKYFSLFLSSCLATSLMPFNIQDIAQRGEIPPIEVKVGLSETIAQDISNAFASTGDAINKNVDSLFDQIGHSMPKMGPGFVSLGESFGTAMGPARNQIIKGFAYSAAITTCAFLIKRLGEKYIKKHLFEPQLIERRSHYGLLHRLKSLVRSSQVNIRDHMIISEQLEGDLNYIMAMTSNIKKHGGQYENILLYGLPGTGKTLFAQLLAEHCGMEYAIIPAANISQFLASNTVVEELNNLFTWAASKKRGTVIFFDEAETFLADRSTLSAIAQNALGAFLAKTGTPSNKIMIMCATNRPQILDAAVLSRFGMRVEFPMPDAQARQEQLALHIKKIFEKQQGTLVAYECLKDAEFVKTLAEKLEGFSGRTIQKFVNRIRQQVLAQDMREVTPELIEHVIEKLVQEQKPIVHLA